jgi:S-adenosylmethionine:tRNA ribosyltransferase-isomerase
MVVDRRRRTIEHREVKDLPRLLHPHDLLIANDSRVIPARLRARKASGGMVELLLLPGAESSTSGALAKSAKPLRVGQVLMLDDGSTAVVRAAGSGRCVLDFAPAAAVDVAMRLGTVPLPPYIRSGKEGPGDRERYQTVYARVPGSVAAPTAGLHFTRSLLDEIENGGVRFRTLTLHVGPGTFTPIRGEPEHHVMEREQLDVTRELASEVAAARASGGRIVAIGTTTVRALESAADPRRPGQLHEARGDTELFIRPGYRFKICDAVMTNFHLPRSSLLCLVMALAGEDLLRRAYDEAVRLRYRFYSYGDAMLIV